jgi:hypothetical protein
VNFAHTVSLLVLPAVCAWGATTYDFVQQFSTTQNPAGAWSYGYRDVNLGTYSPYSTNLSGTWALFGYAEPLPLPPGIYIQGVGIIAGDADPGGAVLRITTRPQPSFPPAAVVTDQPTLRFTAPQSGTYTVEFSFSVQPESPDRSCHVSLRANGVSLLEQDANQGQSRTNRLTVELSAGGIVDLIHAGNTAFYRGTVTLTDSHITPAVSFHPPGGLFTNSLAVSLINNLATGLIRYTTNSDALTGSSAQYADPIVLTVATDIRAAIFDNGSLISQVSTASFARVYAVDDGIPAGWREQYFGSGYLTDPRVSREADPDADGSTNWEEYLAGTHPLDPTSGFKATVEAVPRIRFASEPGRTYRILYRDRLGSAPTILATVTATNAVTTLVDASTTSATGFYVIELLSP